MYCTFLMLFECAATVNVTVIIFEQMLLLLSLTMAIALSCCWLLRSYECIQVCACVCVRVFALHCICAEILLTLVTAKAQRRTYSGFSVVGQKRNSQISCSSIRT